ncbi:hypothetical protein Bbelb_261410 [Branchiostoma belcheri]|nr:hypothetical protein Bbelb_261410 [Branchiostoma belcheri]
MVPPFLKKKTKMAAGRWRGGITCQKFTFGAAQRQVFEVLSFSAWTPARSLCHVVCSGELDTLGLVSYPVYQSSSLEDLPVFLSIIPGGSVFLSIIPGGSVFLRDLPPRHTTREHRTLTEERRKRLEAVREKRHRTATTSTTEYQCSRCGKLCASAFGLRSHQRIHPT